MPASRPITDRRFAGSDARERTSVASVLLLALIRGYQLFGSWLFAGACRYSPSCSRYASEAIRRHGACRGGWLAMKRLGRCHPWGGQGYDPVPPAAGRSDESPSDGSAHPDGADGASRH